MTTTTTKPAANINIGALVIDYPGRFDASEIPDEPVRLNLNAACRAFEGANAIAKILYSNAIEIQAHGDEATVLDSATSYGLFEALLFLTENGSNNAQEVGEAIFKQTKQATTVRGVK